MARACHASVRMATGDKFSDAEIDDILERLAKRYEERVGKAPTEGAKASLRAAAAEMTRDELLKALVEKRMKLAAARSTARFEDLMARMPGQAADNFRAFMVGSDYGGFGKGLSIDATGRAMEADLWGGMERAAKEAGALDRISGGIWGKADFDFELKVAQEMSRLNGGKELATGDVQAEALAKAFNAALERGRTMQNLEGAWIGKLEGYIVRQHHDALKVAGGFWSDAAQLGRRLKEGKFAARTAAADKAFATWRNFIGPLLHDRTFEGVDEAAAKALETGDVTPAQNPRERFLQAVWWDIVTGRHSILKGMSDTADLVLPASKARSVSAHRVLHFRDAAAWMAYDRKFGGGNLYRAVVGDLSRAAKNTALMRGFGPNPEASFKARRERLLGSARDRGDVVSAKTLLHGKTDQSFEALTGAGSAPENLRLAHIGKIIRAQQSLSKLGGMVLSATGDVPIASQTLVRAGMGWFESYGGVLAGLTRMNGAEARQIADLLDVGARGTAGHVTSRFSGGDGPVGWTAWAMTKFYKANGFAFWNDGLRMGVAHMLASHLGNEASKIWEGLNIGTREWLERYGIGQREWELLRKGTQEIGGKTWLTHDAVDAISPEDLHGLGRKGDGNGVLGDERLRQDLRTRLQTLFSDTLDIATSEPGAKERMAISATIRGRPLLTEAIKLFTQFWSFPLTFLNRSLGPAARGFAGQKPIGLVAHLFLATTLMGYLSRQAKLIVAGHQPDALYDENGHPRLSVWTAAALQGGGLGIYGDFLFGEYNRMGGSKLATLGGPTVGTFEQAWNLFAQAKTAFLSTDEKARDAAGKDLSGNAVKFGVQQVPGANIWYTKLALDYLLLWRVNEALSPGWASRYEERVNQQTGSDWWLHPSEAVR